MELRLAARPPFLLASVVRSHGWIRLAPFAEDASAGGLRYVLRLQSGRVAEIAITEDEGGVRVAADAALGQTEQDEARDAVSWMLGLDQDFSTFYEYCRHQPKLAHAEQAARGRLLRSPTLFEDVIKTLLTTNTAWSGTIRMNEALVARYGDPLSDDGARRRQAWRNCAPAPSWAIVPPMCWSLRGQWTAADWIWKRLRTQKCPQRICADACCPSRG